MKRSLGSVVIVLAVVALGGAAPGCNCAHNGGNGDGGGGSGASGGGSGGDGGFNACGDNDPSCMTACLGPTCVPPGMFPLPSDMPPDPNVGADGVGRDPNGWIVLNQGSSSFNYLWIADDQAYFVGMVSKIDTRKSTAAGGAVNHDYREVARYLTVTCESNESSSWRDHSGYVISTAGATMLGTCDGTNGCCARTAMGTARTPVQLYHNRPSRTAVDFNGDAWVANRAHDSYGSPPDPIADATLHHQSSVTKIANKNNSIIDTDCKDRNNNGKIDTSYDANGDGIINTDCNGDGIPDSLSNVTTAKPCIGGTMQEFFGLDDECVLFTTNTGAEGGTGRPLALGQGGTDFAPSDAWAGRFTDGIFYRVDGQTGLIKATLPLTVGGVAARPYGAAIDQTGILWAPNVENPTLYYADTNNLTNIGKISPPGTIAGQIGFYGIAIDGYKAPLTAGGPPSLIQDVWMAVYGSPHLVRYTPQRSSGTFAALGTGVFTDFTWTGAMGNGRGVGVDNRTPTSFAWVALDGSNGLGQVAVDANFLAPNGTLSLQSVTLPAAQVHSTNGGITTLGAGVAADLDLWGVNQSNDPPNVINATHFHVDSAGTVTPPTSADQVRLDDNGLTSGGVAHRAPYPYTYSDFTGFGLRNFTNPHGSYSYIWTGCGVGKTKWISVKWDAATPPGTAISMKARSSDDKTTFSSATFTGNYTSSPADLLNAAPSGGSALAPNPSGFLQVEFDLTTTDKNSTPALKSYTVVYECVAGIG
jgi:hypothetical protein